VRGRGIVGKEIVKVKRKVFYEGFLSMPRLKLQVQHRRWVKDRRKMFPV